VTRLVVLASGAGTNAAEIIAACDDGRIDGTVAAVVTNRPQAGVVARAQAAGVVVETVAAARDEERVDYDARLATVVAAHSPDVVVLAGWMRILSMGFLDAVRVPVVNLHPALPGDLPGVGAIERAFAERDSGRTSSGVMVHLVPDEGVDSGPVLASAAVPLLASDTIAEFAERMHAMERRLLVEVLSDMHLRIELTESTRHRRGERLP
jgi:phosphoribosylglycinamide formyltransferase-1